MMKSKKDQKSAAEEASGETTLSFAQQVLEEINNVRKNPQGIIRQLQEQMNEVDSDNVLQVPGRDPI